MVRKHNGYCEGALFCLVRYSDAKMDAAKLISLYFELGSLQKDIILSTLAKEHRIIISRRTLQRMLKMMKLCRRQYSDIGNVNVFIHLELNESYGKCTSETMSGSLDQESK